MNSEQAGVKSRPELIMCRVDHPLKIYLKI
jgi:hypothetical protein